MNAPLRQYLFPVCRRRCVRVAAVAIAASAASAIALRLQVDARTPFLTRLTDRTNIGSKKANGTSVVAIDLSTSCRWSSSWLHKGKQHRRCRNRSLNLVPMEHALAIQREMAQAFLQPISQPRVAALPPSCSTVAPRFWPSCVLAFSPLLAALPPSPVPPFAPSA